MSTFINHTTGAAAGAQRLRRRWHDIEHELLRLSTGLALVPEPCSCGDDSAHLRETSTCGASRESTSGARGNDCDRLLQSVERQMHALIADTLRLLPPLPITRSTNSDGTRADDLRRQVDVVAGIVGRLRTAAAEYREAGSPAYLRVVTQRTQDLFRAGRRLNEMLERDIG